jgi:hypothetical protein
MLDAKFHVGMEEILSVLTASRVEYCHKKTHAYRKGNIPPVIAEIIWGVHPPCAFFVNAVPAEASGLEESL